MRRTIIVLPELPALPGGESVLRSSLPNLQRLAEEGEVSRLAPLPNIETPEAIYLGMRHDEAQLRQGPLTVSALGHDPPERSTHFHVSLMSLNDGVVQMAAVVPGPEDLAAILAAAEKLNSKTLTLLPGEELDHGLVWEGLGDIGTTSAADASGRPLRTVLPEGDAERILRRFIDDSVNILGDLELNARRVDEDLPPFNLLWPWGHGVRIPVPNLALKRGEPAAVQSETLRMAGLARLAGYRHGDRNRFRRALNLDLPGIARLAIATELLLVLISAPAELRAAERFEELEWFTNRLDADLIGPLLEASRGIHAAITLVAPTQNRMGLALRYDSKTLRSNTTPFDERTLEDPKLKPEDASNVIAEALS